MLCVPKPRGCVCMAEERRIFNFMVHVNSIRGTRNGKGATKSKNKLLFSSV